MVKKVFAIRNFEPKDGQDEENAPMWTKLSHPVSGDSPDTVLYRQALGFVQPWDHFADRYFRCVSYRRLDAYITT